MIKMKIPGVATALPGFIQKQGDVTKNPEILQKYPIMAAPCVVINGKLEFAGGAEGEGAC